MAKAPSTATVTDQQVKIVVVPQAPVEKTFLEQATPYLPLIITIVGWWVVSFQNDRRERRKEVRELIKLFEERVDGALSLAVEYYALTGKDPKCSELSAKIRHNLAALDPLREKLNASGLKCEIVNEIVIFRQSITSGEFESPKRSKIAPGSQILAEASAAGFVLVRKVDQAFQVAFR